MRLRHDEVSPSRAQWSQGAYLSQLTLPMRRPCIAIDAWSPMEFEQVGTKPKQWYESPGGARWLYKEATLNPIKGGAEYLRGDDWAEVIASDLGRALGLPTAQVELASLADTVGVISRSVSVGAALVMGNEVLSGQDPLYAQESARVNPRYTVPAVMTVMRGMLGPRDFAGGGASQAFAGYLILDGLVGNTDRHHQNWAALRRRGSPTRLAPTFDHASSLGALLDDARRIQILQRPEGIAAYTGRAKTPFAEAASPLDASIQAWSELAPAAQIRWQEVVESIPTVVEEVVERVPSHRMSPAGRRFVLALVAHNHTALTLAMRRRRRD